MNQKGKLVECSQKENEIVELDEIRSVTGLFLKKQWFGIIVDQSGKDYHHIKIRRNCDVRGRTNKLLRGTYWCSHSLLISTRIRHWSSVMVALKKTSCDARSTQHNKTNNQTAGPTSRHRFMHITLALLQKWKRTTSPQPTGRTCRWGLLP